MPTPTGLPPTVLASDVSSEGHPNKAVSQKVRKRVSRFQVPAENNTDLRPPNRKVPDFRSEKSDLNNSLGCQKYVAPEKT